MKPFFTALVAMSMVTGCRFGPKIEQVSLARSPRGAMYEVTKFVGVVNGELLAVIDDGLVVLEGQRMVTVPFSEIRDARTSELGSDYRVRDGKRPNPQLMARLRRVSHFPQGITPEIQARLLTLYPQ
jgi:hypothetical protein